MEITEQQRELTTILNKLLNYGSDKMSGFGMNRNKYKLKKRTLYLMMCAHQSYSEAIFKLMSNPPVYDKAAEVLYRPLTENLINIQFIYSDRTYKNSRRFLAYSVQDQIDFAKKHRNFMIKYPEWNLKFGKFTKPDDWNQFILKKNYEADHILKRYKLSHKSLLPGLVDRAIVVDKYLKGKNKFKESMSMEKYYVLYYKFFSQVTHLTFPGLERFYEIDKEGNEKIIVDGDSDSINRILSITYQIYYVVLRFCLKEFGIFNKEEFVEYDKFSRNIR